MTIYSPDDLETWLLGVFQRDAFWNSKDEVQRPWVFRCPKKDCYFSVGAKSEDDAKFKAKRHAESDCPRVGAIHFGASITMNLVEDMWLMADREYDKLQATHDGKPLLDGDKLQQQRGVLAGVCRCIILFMSPRFPTLQDVSKELNKRHEAGKRGEAYTTPGLGNRMFMPPAPQATIEERTANVLSDNDQAAIKMAFKMKVMTIEQVCKMYSISKAVAEKLMVDANASS